MPDIRASLVGRTVKHRCYCFVKRLGDVVFGLAANDIQQKILLTEKKGATNRLVFMRAIAGLPTFTKFRVLYFADEGKILPAALIRVEMRQYDTTTLRREH